MSSRYIQLHALVATTIAVPSQPRAVQSADHHHVIVTSPPPPVLPLQLFEVLDTEQMIYLIMENADKGEMFDYIVRHQVRFINITNANAMLTQCQHLTSSSFVVVVLTIHPFIPSIPARGGAAGMLFFPPDH